MKKMYILLLIICLTGVLLASCGSSKPCPAYKSVSSVISPVEFPPETDQPS